MNNYILPEPRMYICPGVESGVCKGYHHPPYESSRCEHADVHEGFQACYDKCFSNPSVGKCTEVNKEPIWEI